MPTGWKPVSGANCAGRFGRSGQHHNSRFAVLPACLGYQSVLLYLAAAWNVHFTCFVLWLAQGGCTSFELTIRERRPSNLSASQISKERPGTLGIVADGLALTYLCTRCRTNGMLAGGRMFRFLDGSDPSGGGPIAGRDPVGSEGRIGG